MKMWNKSLLLCVANDVVRWTANQSKDIAAIGACASQFSSKIELLKSELSAEHKKNKEASSRIASTKKEAATERETSASMRRQYEAKLKVSWLQWRRVHEARRKGERAPTFTNGWARGAP